MISRFLDEGDTFAFACQMTGDCCRHYTILCTPYDIVRLRRATGASTTAMIADGVYEVVEESFGAVFGGDTVNAVLGMFGVPIRDRFPVARLRTVRDGRGPKCTFLQPDGACGVYPDRPGVCRSYPLGRLRTPDGPRWFEREYGCPGKGQGTQELGPWIAQSGLAAYAAGNDRFADFVADVRAAGIDVATLPPPALEHLRTVLYDFDRILDVAPCDDAETLTRIDTAARAWLAGVSPTS